jgi:hypothetical protein
MSTSRLPVIANWLLRRFGRGPHRDSQIGDLDEQFARGRSSWWYWRQVLATILAGIASDSRQHPRVAIRSIALTWLIVIACVESTWALYLWASEKWVYAWVNDSALLFEFWIPFGGGLSVLWCAGSAASGWISSRLTDEHSVMAVATSVIAQIPLALWWGVPFWLHAGDSARFSTPLHINAVFVLAGMPTCALIAGLWGVRDAPASHVR